MDIIFLVKILSDWFILRAFQTIKGLSYHIYQPLRSGRIWHKVNS